MFNKNYGEGVGMACERRVRWQPMSKALWCPVPQHARRADRWRGCSFRWVGVCSLLLVVLLAGCATPPPVTDREAYQEYVETNDPFEPTNRAVFEFNRALDEALFQPIARAYRSAVPLWVRQRVGDALENLRAPVVFLNDVLQGEGDRAMTTLVRFMINSSIGVAGLADMAGEMGIKGHDEDFGQTLAVWGAEDGPYIMLPIFGPSNPRDTVGRVVDWVVDPFNQWADNTGREEWILARGGVSALHTRTELLDLTDDLEKSSLDLYAAVRSLYRQRRAHAISNGGQSEKIPELSSAGFPSLNDN